MTPEQKKLFIIFYDMDNKQVSLNKRYIVSIVQKDTLVTEIKTSLGDVIKTKHFPPHFYSDSVSTIGHENEGEANG